MGRNHFAMNMKTLRAAARQAKSDLVPAMGQLARKSEQKKKKKMGADY